jgi:ketosteroid isomerase-like protein
MHREEKIMSRRDNNKNNRLDLSEITKTVCAVDRALIAAEASRDIDTAMNYLAAEVILQPPDMPMVVGREAVRKFYTAWFSVPYISIEVHSQKVNVASSGDLAYLVGESSFIFDGPQGELQVPGKYLGVWKKVEGEWKLSAISWSGNASPGTP